MNMNVNLNSKLSILKLFAKNFVADITPSGIVAGATMLGAISAICDGDIEVFTQTASDIDGSYTEVDSIQEAIAMVEDHARASADEESWYASVDLDDEIIFEAFDN